MSVQENKKLEFKLSAPGKVILFGEYSVVFNKPAVAATLSLQTKLHFLETSAKIVELNFSAMKINNSFELTNIEKNFKNLLMEDDYIQSLTKAVKCLYKKTYGVFDFTDGQKLSVITFFHCFRKIFFKCNGFRLNIDTELPVGSGVGSSASFSVVLSAAALIYEYYIENKGSISNLIERSRNDSLIVSEVLKAQISDLAFFCEKIFHGTPSGIDHNTILQGSMLEFVKSEHGNKISYVTTSPMRIILVNTNVPRSTKRQLEFVKELKANHPEIIDSVLLGMENVVKSALIDLKKFKENSEKIEEVEKHFGELINFNHGLLRVLGTSHPALEQIILCAKKFNLNAKLTGAGGGGFGFIYLPKNIEESILKTIQQELTLAGFTIYEVFLGGPGLTVEELMH